ncbi:hypothetical protein PbB2_01288 [Candidatus Phycosocius bacilliformis]|uniref:DUF4410 domain-containing protein n=1 Tax=Candidatus Phycosocius bacilliformis TaxID=1445552 RepID=A0A2P2E978_9PROT|nr:hypothetical protein [Candidatus Phycosocius bacilliformis]GBF57620.1 hypothetical protein PbB2_01288 [Candidatus Phycosocius bacilliformis]
MVKLMSAGTLLFAMLAAGSAMAEPLQVNVSFGEAAQKKLEKTYGLREKAVIEEMVVDNLRETLKGGVARVDVVVHDMTANRPTFQELNDKPGLSLQSFGIGGADVSGKAYDAAGNLLGEASYNWTGDIFWADAAWVWSDTDRTLSVFARKLAKAVPG